MSLKLNETNDKLKDSISKRSSIQSKPDEDSKNVIKEYEGMLQTEEAEVRHHISVFIEY